MHTGKLFLARARPKHDFSSRGLQRGQNCWAFGWQICSYILACVRWTKTRFTGLGCEHQLPFVCFCKVVHPEPCWPPAERKGSLFKRGSGIIMVNSQVLKDACKSALMSSQPLKC